MKRVTEAYDTAMDQTIRPTSQVEVRMEIADRGVVEHAAVTQAPAADFATSAVDTNHQGDYATFEPDFMQVGSSQMIAPTSDYIRNGYVSDELSGADGTFTNPPVIDVFFGEGNAVTFANVSLTFVKDYPTSITMTAYQEDTVLKTVTITPDALQHTENVGLKEISRLVFTFHGMHEANRRLRVASLQFGYMLTYTNDDILSCTEDMIVDPISSSLPQHEFTVNLANYEHIYDPDNPSGVWESFENGQTLKVRYGTVVNGQTEWLDYSTLLLSDSPTVYPDRVAFTAWDALAFLTDTYYRGTYYSAGRTLYDLAVDVLRDAGVSKYRLPLSLQNIRTGNPLPAVSHRECLQLIANAGCCTLYTDKDGYITLDDTSPSTADYYLSYDKALDRATVSKTSALKSVDMTVTTYIPAEDRGTVYESDVYVDGNTTLQINYMACTNLKAEIQNGIIDSKKLFSRHAELTISQKKGSKNKIAKVKITGKILTESTSEESFSVGYVGENCPVENPLIDTKERARIVANWIAAYLTNRNTYESQVRQDFRLEPSDLIYFENDFSKKFPARIEKLQFNLPGQTGAIKVRRVNVDGGT